MVYAGVVTVVYADVVTVVNADIVTVVYADVVTVVYADIVMLVDSVTVTAGSVVTEMDTEGTTADEDSRELFRIMMDHHINASTMIVELMLSRYITLHSITNQQHCQAF